MYHSTHPVRCKLTATSVFFIAVIVTPRAVLADDLSDSLAGSYIGAGHASAVPVPIFDILTFRADGTFTGTAYDDFAFGDIAAGGFTSPEHGTWRQIGSQRIGTSSLSLGYDANGALQTFVRVNSQGTLSDDLQTLNGRFQVLIFQATQNLLEDEPVAIVPGTYSVRRNGEAHAPDEIATRLTGTYFGSGTAEGLDSEIVDLLTFHGDGTFIGTANDDFGFADIAAEGFNSSEHGVWRQTSANSIATSSLAFGYDANGLFENIFEVVSTSSISEDFQNLGGPFHVDVFASDQDPLVDDPIAPMILTGEYSVRRIAPSDTRTDFGKQIAGTYFGVANAEGVDVPIVDNLTFGADGTFVGTANDDYGFGDIAANGFTSPEHGTWQQTGPNSIATSSLSLGFDSNGLLDGFVQVVSEAMFSEDLQTLTGTFSVNIFQPDQDPLTDTPVAVLPGSYEFRRLVAVPEPATVGLLLAALTAASALRRRSRQGQQDQHDEIRRSC